MTQDEINRKWVNDNITTIRSLFTQPILIVQLDISIQHDVNYLNVLKCFQKVLVRNSKNKQTCIWRKKKSNIYRLSNHFGKCRGVWWNIHWPRHVKFWSKYDIELINTIIYNVFQRPFSPILHKGVGCKILCSRSITKDESNRITQKTCAIRIVTVM